MHKDEHPTGNRPAVLVACLLVLSSCPGGCPLAYLGPEPGENFLAEVITFAYLVGSGLRGSSAHRCDSEGVGCSIFAPVGCGTCEDATIVPELSPLVVLALRQEGAPRQTEAGRRAIVVGDRSAEIVNLETNTLVKKIDLSGFGVRVAVSDDGRFAAVRVSASGGAGGVDILDLETLELTDTVSFAAECAPRGVAFVPGSHDFFVSCRDAGALRRFSIEGGVAGDMQEEISGCDGPGEIVFTADGQRGLFTCTESVWVYDVATASIAWEIPGFVEARNLAVRLDGTRAYVNDRNSSNGYRLVVVDLATYDWLGETPLEGFPSDLFLGSGDSIVYSLTGNRLHLANAAGEVQSSASTPVFALAGFSVDLPAQ